MKKISLLIIIGFIIISCSPTLYLPASNDAKIKTQLVQGRNSYVQHCSSCHNLHLPSEYNASEWKTNLDAMQYKAKINDEEKELIYMFLTSEQK